LINPAVPLLFTSSGGRSPRLMSSSRKSPDASADPESPAARNEHRRAVGGDAHPASTGSARAPACIFTIDASRNR